MLSRVSVPSLTEILSSEKTILLLILIVPVACILSYRALDIPSVMWPKPDIPDGTYPPQITKRQLQQLNDALAKAQEQKIIIEWYSRPHMEVPPQDTDVCGNCLFTDNRSMIDHPSASAVTFHFRFIKPWTMPRPSERRADQLYIWRTGEAPPSLLYMSKKDLKFEDQYEFNATSSHRRDSDIQIPYGSPFRTFQRTQHLRKRNDPLFNKTKLAVAAVSNCGLVPGAYLRVEILKNISQAGLDIDLFGACFERSSSIPKDKSTNFKSLLNQYKFYFSFENSYHCRDYATEKLFQNAFESGSVPVVWGPTKETVERLAPPHSYIFAEDFLYQELVEYLNYLDSNDTAYLEYFRWYTMDEREMSGFGQVKSHCQLCRIVHGINVNDVLNPLAPSRPLLDESMTRRVVPSLSGWYFGTENDECKMNPTQLRELLLTRKPASSQKVH